MSYNYISRAICNKMFEEQKECVRLDSYTFVALVDKKVVGQGGKLEIIFRNGMKYTYSLE